MDGKVLFVGLSLLLQLNQSQSQFPRACATLEAYLSHECCPSIRSGELSCGEGDGRGVCDVIKVDEEPWSGSYTLRGIDDRERWPERFFNRSCRCFGNFGGFDCGKCKPGWMGRDCDQQRPLAVRKNILDMPVDDATKFLNALDLAKTTEHPDYVVATDHYRNLLNGNGTLVPNYVNISIYDYFVWMHYYSVRDTLLGPGQAFTDIDFSHEGPAFVTWHRLHLLKLEEDLRELIGDESLAIPYWNFAIGGSDCDICTDNLLGARHPTEPTRLSDNSRFADWQVVCLSIEWFDENVKLCNGTEEGPVFRNPGGNIDRPAVQNLPDPAEVLECLNVIDYDAPPYSAESDLSFRNTLEGYAEADGRFVAGTRSLHNLAHLFLNGTGGQTHASANDPIFVLLHSFTDAIFEEWLRRSGSTTPGYPARNAPIGHNLEYNMAPFFPPITNREMLVSSRDLGYIYEINFQDFQQNPPSIMWVMIGVVAFIAFVIMTTVCVTKIKSAAKRKKEEGLYQKLIEETYDEDLEYGT